MKSVCVFLGSSPGKNPVYMEAAKAMGQEIARRGMTCVYGGSCTGLMDALANSAMEAGGKVVGVTVQALKDKECHHKGLTELHVVETMDERKKMMGELAEGFIALPGGIGTFEEFFEVCTLKQLGFHSKPCGLLDINDFYAPFDLLMGKAEDEGFMNYPHLKMIHRTESPADMLDLMKAEALQKK
ncbi:MAG: TIGR00730 family Rossman fold protein [Desulfovibrio sp.]